MNTLTIKVTVCVEDMECVLSDIRSYLDVINPESETFQILILVYSKVNQKAKGINDWTNILSDITNP